MMARYSAIALILIIAIAGCVGQKQEGMRPEGLIRFEEIEQIEPSCHELPDANNKSNYAICPAWELRAYAGSLSIEGMVVEATNETSEAPAALGEIDNEGRFGIIIAAPDMVRDEKWANQVKAITPEGMLAWYAEIDGEKSTKPTIADIDDDGHKEILVGTDNGTAYAIKPNGTVMWRYRTNKPIDKITASKDAQTKIIVTAQDEAYMLDNEGILLGKEHAEKTGLQAVVTGEDGRTMMTLTAENETLHAAGPDGGSLWEYRTGAKIRGKPVAEDINNDGKKEIILASDGIYVLNEKGELANFTLYGQDGSAKGHYKTGAPIYAAPAIADLDLDGTPEIITVTSDGREVILSASRKYLANNPGAVNFKGIQSPAPTMKIEKNSPFASAPLIARLDKDPYPDRIYFIPDAIKQGTGRQIGSALFMFFPPSVKPITEPAVNIYSNSTIKAAEEPGYKAQYSEETKEVLLTIESGKDAYLMQYDGITSELEKERTKVCQENERMQIIPSKTANGTYAALQSGACALEEGKERKGHETIFMKEKTGKGEKKEIIIPVKTKPVQIRLLVVEDVLDQECTNGCDALDEKWYSLGNVRYENIEVN